MYQSQELLIKDKLDNSSLVYCTTLAAKIKEPMYIPLYEVYTYDLIAEYFGLTEKRIMNAYRNGRGIFTNDCGVLSGKEIVKIATDVKNLGKSYGHLCTFHNGLKALIAYSANMVFNSRALLNFALILKDESDVAAQISEMLMYRVFPVYYGKTTEIDKSKAYNTPVKPMKLWFLTEPPTQNKQKFECPYGYCPPAVKDEERKEIKNIKKETKKSANKSANKNMKEPKSNKKLFHQRSVGQYSLDGELLLTYNSMKEASYITGTNKDSISNCCRGEQRTANGFVWKYA